MTDKKCLWLAKDGRCACCKAKRIRLDVLKLENYEMCDPEHDYPNCEFFKELPPAKK